MGERGKLVVFGPEVPDINTLVYPNIIEIMESPQDDSFILSTSLKFGLAKALGPEELNTWLAEGIGFTNV